MTPWWIALLKSAQRDQLAGIAGARAAVRLPIDERLLNQLIAEYRSEDWPIRELTVELLDRDELVLRVRPKAGFVPTIQVRVTIEQQPELPASPLLILRIGANPLTSMAIAAVRSKVKLPAGIQFDDDRIRIDLQALAEAFGQNEWLPLLTRLRINTKPHLLVLDAEAAVPLLPNQSG
jgi:hypothetical protein